MFRPQKTLKKTRILNYIIQWPCQLPYTIVNWTITASHKKNNRSRDEKQEKTAGYNWTNYKINIENAKILIVSPILDIIWDYRRNCIHVNRMPHTRLPRIIKKTTQQMAKEPGKTYEETSGCARLKWFNKT